MGMSSAMLVLMVVMMAVMMGAMVVGAGWAIVRRRARH